MNHIINGKSGIVKIGVSGRTTVDGLSKSLLESIDVPLEAWNEGTEVAIFGKICEAVHDGMWTPTVVFDVEGNVRKEVLQELVKTAKRLTSDEKLARVFIVLSGSMSAEAFLSDKARHIKIYVPDFTENEAIEYLRRLNYKPDIKEGMERVIREIGTRPIDLEKIASSGLPFEEYVHDIIIEDQGNVRDSLKLEKRSIPFLRKLINLEYNDGMNANDASNLLDLPVSEITSSAVVKIYHILRYNFEESSFQFVSPTMYNATKNYFKINKAS
jgi:hypothetical protein